LNKKIVCFIETKNNIYIYIYINQFLFSIELKEAFALFDRIGRGAIRTKDLAYVMHSIGYQTTPTELEQMIREADQDGWLNYYLKKNFFLI